MRRNEALIAGAGVALYNPGAVLVSENTTWEDNIGNGDIAFVTYDDGPEDVIVHATFDADGRTDFTCTFDTLTCE